MRASDWAMGPGSPSPQPDEPNPDPRQNEPEEPVRYPTYEDSPPVEPQDGLRLDDYEPLEDYCELDETG